MFVGVLRVWFVVLVLVAFSATGTWAAPPEGWPDSLTYENSTLGVSLVIPWNDGVGRYMLWSSEWNINYFPGAQFSQPALSDPSLGTGRFSMVDRVTNTTLLDLYMSDGEVYRAWIVAPELSDDWGGIPALSFGGGGDGPGTGGSGDGGGGFVSNDIPAAAGVFAVVLLTLSPFLLLFIATVVLIGVVWLVYRKVCRSFSVPVKKGLWGV